MNQAMMSNLTDSEFFDYISNLYLDSMQKEDLYLVLKNVQQRGFTSTPNDATLLEEITDLKSRLENISDYCNY